MTNPDPTQPIDEPSIPSDGPVDEPPKPPDDVPVEEPPTPSDAPTREPPAGPDDVDAPVVDPRVPGQPSRKQVD